MSIRKNCYVDGVLWPRYPGWISIPSSGNRQQEDFFIKNLFSSFSPSRATGLFEWFKSLVSPRQKQDVLLPALRLLALHPSSNENALEKVRKEISESRDQLLTAYEKSQPATLTPAFRKWSETITSADGLETLFARAMRSPIFGSSGNQSWADWTQLSPNETQQLLDRVRVCGKTWKENMSLGIRSYWTPNRIKIGSFTTIFLSCVGFALGYSLRSSGLLTKIKTTIESVLPNETFSELAGFAGVIAAYVNIVGPICEEIGFRAFGHWVTKKILRKSSDIIGYPANETEVRNETSRTVGIVFGASHHMPGSPYPIIQLPLHISMGRTLGHIYERYGLTSSIAAHISNNVHVTGSIGLAALAFFAGIQVNE